MTLSSENFPPKGTKVSQACNRCRTKTHWSEGSSNSRETQNYLLILAFFYLLETPCCPCKRSGSKCQYNDSQRCDFFVKNAQIQQETQILALPRHHLKTWVSGDDDDDAEYILSNSGETQRGVFSGSNLRHLRFISSDLYQYLINATKSQHPHLYYRVPPLLYDFFNITAQPVSVWVQFTDRYEVLHTDVAMRPAQRFSLRRHYASFIFTTHSTAR